MDEQTRSLIREQFGALARRRFEVLDQIKLNNLDLNPFLLRAIGFKSAEEIAEFLVNQRLERSLVTSYGSRIQRIGKEISGSGTGTEGADILKVKEGRNYYIQMKAGPNTVNKDISSTLNTLLKSATRRNRGSVAFLGMTYGKPQSVSNIIQKYSEVDWRVGREFWEFISDDPHCAKEIFDLIGEIESSITDDGSSFSERRQIVVSNLANEIKNKYGEGSTFWDRLFEDNM
jgi:hypothetical protein